MIEFTQLELPLWQEVLQGKFDDEAIEWTLDEIIRLHSVLLAASLDVLSKRAQAKEKLEVLQWIFTDFVSQEIYDSKTGLLQVVSVPTEALPLSFKTCCKLEGMDPEKIRDSLIEICGLTSIQ